MKAFFHLHSYFKPSAPSQILKPNRKHIKTLTINTFMNLLKVLMEENEKWRMRREMKVSLTTEINPKLKREARVTETEPPREFRLEE